MDEKIIYVSPENLEQYDGLIKDYAKSIASKPIEDGIAHNIVAIGENGELIDSKVSISDVASNESVREAIGEIPAASKTTTAVGYAEYIATEKANNVVYDDTNIKSRVTKLENSQNIITDIETNKKYKLCLESGLLCLIEKG